MSRISRTSIIPNPFLIINQDYDSDISEDEFEMINSSVKDDSEFSFLANESSSNDTSINNNHKDLENLKNQLLASIGNNDEDFNEGFNEDFNKEYDNDNNYTFNDEPIKTHSFQNSFDSEDFDKAIKLEVKKARLIYVRKSSSSIDSKEKKSLKEYSKKTDTINKKFENLNNKINKKFNSWININQNNLLEFDNDNNFRNEIIDEYNDDSNILDVALNELFKEFPRFSINNNNNDFKMNENFNSSKFSIKQKSLKKMKSLSSLI